MIDHDHPFLSMRLITHIDIQNSYILLKKGQSQARQSLKLSLKSYLRTNLDTINSNTVNKFWFLNTNLRTSYINYFFSFFQIIKNKGKSRAKQNNFFLRENQGQNYLSSV